MVPIVDSKEELEQKISKYILSNPLAMERFINQINGPTIDVESLLVNEKE